MSASGSGGSSVVSTAKLCYHIPSNAKANFASGAFGDITLAALHRDDDVVVEDEKANPVPNSCKPAISLVAVKTVYLEHGDRDDDNDDEYLTEISCLRRLCEHENIVRLLDAFPRGSTNGRGSQSGGQWWSLVMPYCPLDLHTVLEMRRRTLQPLLSPHTVYHITRQLFAALEHCHKLNIVHCDVKPGNLLVNVESSTIQLCDFGIAQRRTSLPFSHASASADGGSAATQNDLAEQDRRRPRALCTLQYRPPELLLGLSPTEWADPSLDLFSAGVTLAECVSGQMLFPGKSDLGQLSLYFQTMGTPSPSTCPGLVNLPDWEKVSFSSQPHNPDWHLQRIPRLTEFAKDDALTLAIQNTVQLEPSKRWSASACCCELQRVRQFTSSSEQTSLIFDRFITELVPHSIRQDPLLLSPPFGCFDAIDTEIEKIAQKRRDFLTTLQPWNSLAQTAG